MALIDEIIVTNTPGTTRYEEGNDYEIDYGNDRIKRIPGGSISDGQDVRVFYGKQILSFLIGQLELNNTALLPRAKAKIIKLTSPTQDPEQGEDITDDITTCEVELSLSGPGKFRLRFVDATGYSDFDPADGIYLHISAGLAVEGNYIFHPIILGVVEERRLTGEGDFHSLEIRGRDLSALLDFPNASASALSFNPSYKRQVFLNGVLISDDWRAERILAGEALKVDDVVEIAYKRVYPFCHYAIREILKEARWDAAKVSIDIIDFPLAGFDATGLSPLEALANLAARVGASVRAEGGTIVISSMESADVLRTSWTYPSSVIFSLKERELDEQEYTAVQIFGHSETGLAPTHANILPPIDPSMPGYYKLLEKEGSLDPEEPVRTDEPPQPIELTFTVQAGVFDPETLIVSGARLKEKPVKVEDKYEITLLVDWLFDDTAGEPPFFVDENGIRIFFLRGVVYDIIPNSNGEYTPLGHATVERERVDQAEEPVEITCDDSGRYCFDNVTKGIYKLIASHPDYLDNYEDDDPANDVERDLFAEEQEYDEAVENGRYVKQPTDYHLIVWARPSTEAWGLSEHVVDQVRLEVRSTATLAGEPLKYAPPVRDENITTATLAAEIGRLIIASSPDTRHPREGRIPLNPFILPGDAIRISGSEIDQADGSEKLPIDSVVHILKPTNGEFDTIAYSGDFDPSDLCRRHLGNDPHDSLNGIIVGINRDSQGVERCDVTAAGSLFRGLARSPGVPPVKVDDAVLIAKPSRSAVHYLVVARIVDIFGPERTVYV